MAGATPDDVDALSESELTEEGSALARFSLVSFLPLGDAELRAIVSQKADRVRSRYEETHGVAMTVSAGVAEALARRCVANGPRARPIDQTLDREVVAKISESVLRRMAEEAPIGPVRVSMSRNGRIQLRFGERKG